MSGKLSRQEVTDLIEKLESSMIRDECRDCECLQGVLVQIEIDAADNVSDITGPLKITNTQIHSCLGCDPCLPAEIFGDISCLEKL
jgi:hypothetical protein